MPLLGHPKAIGHLDDVDAVDEGFVVLVVLEILPFRLVGMGHDDAAEGNGADVFGADIIAFLRCSQQRMQHLDRRLEHLRSEEHTSELQSLMRISYAVFCLKKKK